eukprot:scaffold1761_cov357-Prasinococcus_capsulatus_cf.AAC.10
MSRIRPTYGYLLDRHSAFSHPSSKRDRSACGQAEEGTLPRWWSSSNAGAICCENSTLPCFLPRNSLAFISIHMCGQPVCLHAGLSSSLDNMIVSREQIMKHDPCVWKNAYIKLVSAATCHRSIFDKTVLSTESLNHYLEGSAGQRRGRRGLLGTEAVDLVGNLDDVGTYMKHAASGTLEHLNHVIWGGKPPHMDGVDFATVYDHECMCNLNSEGLCHSADSLAVVQHVDADSDCDGHKFSDAL